MKHEFMKYTELKKKTKNSNVFMLPKVLKRFVGVIAQAQLTFSSCFDY